MSDKPVLDYFFALEDRSQACTDVWVMDAVSHDDLMRRRTIMAQPTWPSSAMPPSP